MNEPMNQGIQMLLERMKTNPEEFRMEEGSLYSNNKWSRLIHSAISSEVFTKEESDAVREALKVARRDIFTADVVRTLTTEVDDPIKEEWMNEAIVKSATARNLITSSINSGIINNKLYISNGGTGK
jgi:hypothetical protein